MVLPLAIATASVAIDGLAAVLFTTGYLRSRADFEQGLMAFLSAAAGVHATASLSIAEAAGKEPRVGARWAWLALAACVPLAIHFALEYRGVRASRRALFALYLAAAGCAVVDVAWPHVPRWSDAPEGLRLATHVATFIAAAVVLFMMTRALLAGRHEAIALVLGTAVLSACAIQDIGIASGALHGVQLIDAGWAAFAAGVVAAWSSRLAGVTDQLERSKHELSMRTRELRLSDEELHAAQEELVKKEQLAVVGELAAVIAHEVRNPLAIIANAVAGLRRQALSRQDHTTLLEILDEEASRLNRLVTDLLRYARPVNVQRSDFSLSDVLERALSLASKDRKGIKTNVETEGQVRIWGDANLLRQVFDNLVVNAVQAMAAGGTLSVRVRAATEDGVNGVAVDIIDTGEGMDTQVRSRARDPFFTTRPSGTGLGLAIVDRIVDAHGGHFAIESRAGEGTTVTVFLPTGSANEPARSRSRAAKSTSGRLGAG